MNRALMESRNGHMSLKIQSTVLQLSAGDLGRAATIDAKKPDTSCRSGSE